MSASALRVCLLGEVSVDRDGAAVPLPRSRKVRALLAFLALQPTAQSRSRLCDLLWDVPNDPRGELRWCLSKLRGVLDDDVRRRVVTTGTALIALDLSDCLVDAVEVDRLVTGGIQRTARERLLEACSLFRGDLLDGVEIDGNPEFTGWLTAQRQRYRMMRIALVTELALRSPAGSEETFRHLDAWLSLAPFDRRAHEVMLEALVKCGRAGDAEAHLAATLRSFEQEGLDGSSLRDAWLATRRAAAEPARVEIVTGPAIVESPVSIEGRPRRRASVAVMPFVDAASGEAGPSQLGNGLTEDIITRLAKLRVLFVIARGSAYALAERGLGAQEAGRLLSVEYVVSGGVRRQGRRISVVVELAETREARVVWADELEGVGDETFSVLDAIVNRIVAAVADEIETAECNRALLKPPSSLDAWEAYHRGLWHMYKFTGPHNEEAARFFRSALELDPTFARAYAGLSFTHFQNVFLALTKDRDLQMDLAIETAEKSLAADQRDPAAHWAMGRALWLRGAHDASLSELERSVELSPNFALGHYTVGFVQAQTGDPRSAIVSSNHSRQLSPFDPLGFAMLAARALSHIRLGELQEAADWAVKATGRPNAHAHILAIAATSLALANRRDEARAFVARIRQRAPSYSVEDFLRAFRFTPDTEKLFRRCARPIGFDAA